MSTPKHTFLDAAEAWLCDDYSLDIRYLALPTSNGLLLQSALIGLVPNRPKSEHSFCIETARVVVGQDQRYPISKEEILRTLQLAAEGQLEIGGKRLHLAGNPPHGHYSESGHRDKWLSDLHLSVTGGQRSVLSADDVIAIDNELRCAAPPFDGVPDVLNWLSLDPASLGGGNCSVVLRVLPPASIDLSRTSLLNGKLTLLLQTRPTFDVSKLRLAVRGAPGVGILTRLQIAERVTWNVDSAGERTGHAALTLADSDSALVMLMIGDSVVQRRWFSDPVKARSRRLLAVRQFDADLRMVRAAVLNPTDSDRFEQGVAMLLFLLGFSSSVQIERDAPDLVVATPGGQLGIVECTTRIADFSMKLGKLVDRRGALIKAMTVAGHPPDILAILVCGLPSDQIAFDRNELRAQRVKLLAREELVTGLEYVPHPPDPDEMIVQLRKELDA